MDVTEERRATIALHLVADIGPVRFMNLVRHFGSAREALQANPRDLVHVENIENAIAGQITAARDGKEADREIELAHKTGISIVTYLDEAYPQHLRTIHDFPIVLYIKGSLKPADAVSVAVVGTRHPTQYGRAAARRFSADLAAQGITVVSGLARGIDTEAHTATLDAGGRTVAVLGNGLNHHYPPENVKVEERIVAHGALVSEFPLAIGPERGNFPRRNRIISALALATLVVESDIKSGALITARFSAEQGKEVFAVPGPIFSKYSLGPNSLLKAGAHLAESAQDIIDEIRPMAAWVQQPVQVPVHAQPEIQLLSAEEVKIMTALDTESGEISIDRLSTLLSMPSAHLAGSLLELELKGLVTSLPGKLYIRKM